MSWQFAKANLISQNHFRVAG